jgi:hypothetical protein
MRTILLTTALFVATTLSGCKEWRDLNVKFQKFTGQFTPTPTAIEEKTTALLQLTQLDSAFSTRVRQVLEEKLLERHEQCAAEEKSIAESGHKFDSYGNPYGSCLKNHERKIAAWLDFQSVSFLVNQKIEGVRSPLTGVIPLPNNYQMGPVEFAQAAPVAVTWSASSEKKENMLIHVVQLKDGSQPVQFKLDNVFPFGFKLSSNGRVLSATDFNGKTKFVDAQTGRVLAETEQGNRTKHFLPANDLLIIDQTRKPISENFHNLALFDLRTGQAISILENVQKIRWEYPIPGDQGLVLIGAEREVSLMRVKRNEQHKVESTIVRKWAFSFSDQEPLISQPTVLLGGQIAVMRMNQGLVWINLNSGEQGLWPTNDFWSSELTKISDEEFAMHLGFGTGKAPLGIAVVNMRTARVKDWLDAPPSARFRSLGEHLGIGVVADSKITVNTKFNLSNSIPFEQYIADKEVKFTEMVRQAALEEKLKVSNQVSSNGPLLRPVALTLK